LEKRMSTPGAQIALKKKKRGGNTISSIFLAERPFSILIEEKGRETNGEWERLLGALAS